MPTATPVLRVESLVRHFGGVSALDGVDFELAPGEIHALIGENGAGKSTLIRILSGLLPPDAGQVAVDGAELASGSPQASRELGIGVIFQDFDLVPELSIADNLWLGQEPERPWPFLRPGRRKSLARHWLAEVGLDVDPGLRVRELAVAQRQRVAIARALSQRARILVMDEPTSCLAADEVAQLLAHLRVLRRQGTSIVFVSHKLDEVFEVADRVTVLRDGKTVGTRELAATSVAELVAMMVGRELQASSARTRPVPGPALLEVRGLESRGAFHDVGFTLVAGEILGLYGLKGAGRSRLARALFGLEPVAAGEARVLGEPVPAGRPAEAIRHGLALVPGDRKEQGLFPRMGVRENLTIAALDEFATLGLVGRSRERAAARQWAERLKVRAGSLEQPITELSGGNQQKIMLARWLACQPAVLILDEPTAGIDIGARHEIYRFLIELTAAGLGVLLITSDLPELLALSDRVLVMADGAITAEFQASEATEEAIVHAMQA